MKSIVGLLGCGLMAWLQAPSLLSAEPSQAALRKEAKVTQSQAQRVALARVSNGRIQSIELEHEHSRLVWSLDLTRPSSKDITEIQVDAHTGALVSEQTETPAQQASEARLEKATTP